MKKKILLLILLTVLLPLLAACDDESGTPDVTDYQLRKQSRIIAEEFIQSSPTFQFDGIEGTLEQIDDPLPAGTDNWKYIFEFECAHPGYGDRKHESTLIEEITRHEAEITVNAKKQEVKQAIIDGEWDMIDQQDIDDWTWGEAGEQAIYGVISVFAVLILLTLLTRFSSWVIRKMESKQDTIST